MSHEDEAHTPDILPGHCHVDRLQNLELGETRDFEGPYAVTGWNDRGKKLPMVD